MRAIRWSKRFDTGDPAVDRRNRALVGLVGDLRTELKRAEHCQEINELGDRLTELARRRVSESPTDPAGAARTEAEIRELLERGFPLAALSTPACRDCGLCDLMAERVKGWLDED